MTPCVLHVAPLLGGLTDRWIDVQARLADRYDTRLLGARVAPGATRQSHWITPGGRFDRRVAYDWIERSRGLTGAWFVPAVRRANPAVIHAHYGPVAASHRVMAQLSGTSLVASFYGYDATKQVFFTDRRWRREYANLFSYATAVIAEGPAMAARVESLGCPESKLRVVRLPADAETLAGCPARRSEDFLVAIAGRLIEKKGFDTAITAFARGLGGKSDARLMVLGSGEMEAELKRLAAAAGVADQVVWRGSLPFEEFMSHLSAARVALYPSRTAHDGDSEGGAPVTLIEAQWLGVPSIVSDHDDLPFVAAPDGSVVLGSGDVEAWAEVLGELYRAPERVAAMGAAAASFVRAYHSPAANRDHRERIYDAAA